MTILVTGGTGQTAGPLAAQLRAAGHAVLTASRQGASADDGNPVVRFDWGDPTTFAGVFAHPQLQASPLTAAYLNTPSLGPDGVPHVQSFIDQARQHGVTRFVLLSSSAIPENGPLQGQIHAYLHQSGAEWAVVQPSWFMENFFSPTGVQHIDSNGTIASATKDAGRPWVAAKDIADVAFHALTDHTSPNRGLIVTGPESLSVSQAAGVLSEVLQRKIVAREMTMADMTALLVSKGWPPEYARFYMTLEEQVAQGSQSAVSNDVELLTGHPPQSLHAFAQAAQAAQAAGKAS